MSGRESVHGAVPVSAALAKPVVVAVPVHRVTDPRAKCMPEQSRFAEHLARRPCFPGGSSANGNLIVRAKTRRSRFLLARDPGAYRADRSTLRDHTGVMP